MTLEEHCQAERCRLYYTKPESTPKEYEALLEAAIRLKERVLASLAIDEGDVLISQWEIDAYLTFERADRIFQNKKYEAMDDADQSKPKKSKGFIGAGDSKAFGFTDEQLREMYLQRQAREDQRRKRLEEAKKRQ